MYLLKEFSSGYEGETIAVVLEEAIQAEEYSDDDTPSNHRSHFSRLVESERLDTFKQMMAKTQGDVKPTKHENKEKRKKEYEAEKKEREAKEEEKVAKDIADREALSKANSGSWKRAEEKLNRDEKAHPGGVKARLTEEWGVARREVVTKATASGFGRWCATS